METIKVVFDKWLNSYNNASSFGEKLKALFVILAGAPLFIVVWMISFVFPTGVGGEK